MCVTRGEHKETEPFWLSISTNLTIMAVVVVCYSYNIINPWKHTNIVLSKRNGIYINTTNTQTFISQLDCFILPHFGRKIARLFTLSLLCVLFHRFVSIELSEDEEENGRHLSLCSLYLLVFGLQISFWHGSTLYENGVGCLLYGFFMVLAENELKNWKYYEEN